MNNSVFYLLKQILPKSVKSKIKDYQKKKRERKIQEFKDSGSVIDKELIVSQLKELGIKNGDSLLVHSSLSRIGYVENGPETVLKSLFEVLGDEGTLLIPTYPFATDVKSYVDQAPEFDVRNTPSKMGKITEMFRNMEGVKRSFHPTHPVAAIGPLATYYTSEHFNQLTPFNEQSPFRKLSDKKGKILLLGVSLDSLTNFHTLEDAVQPFPFPVYCDKDYDMKMIDERGNKVSMFTKIHNPEMSVKRRCNEFFKLFKEEGVLTEGIVGIKECYLLDAYKLHECMLKNFKTKKITMYTPHGNK